MREVARGDKHNLRNPAHRNAQISVIYAAHCTDLCFAIADPLVAKISGARRKVWILLVVCAATRAVNLQLVSSMSAEDVILAFRWFVSRYGTPLLVRSGNGSAFVTSSKVLSIEWRFNPPLSPWHGGFYERLVGVVKAPLKRVLKRSLLSYEELQTLLAEVEYLVNDRPITYVGRCDDLAPLTPHLLLGSQVGYSGVEERSLNHKLANRRIKYLFELRDNLHKRWTEEYISALRTYAQQQTCTRSFSVGDTVLMCDDQKKRQDWKLARVSVQRKGWKS